MLFKRGGKELGDNPGRRLHTAAYTQRFDRALSIRVTHSARGAVEPTRDLNVVSPEYEQKLAKRMGPLMKPTKATTEAIMYRDMIYTLAELNAPTSHMYDRGRTLFIDRLDRDQGVFRLDEQTQIFGHRDAVKQRKTKQRQPDCNLTSITRNVRSTEHGTLMILKVVRNGTSRQQVEPESRPPAQGNGAGS